VGYLKTILTYNQPSEAEVDRAFLESRGIAVCLFNANTSRNELGAPFYIQLQVGEECVDIARRLIREVNPPRFGSSDRVNEIDCQLKRALARFVLVAVPVGIVVGVVTYFLTPNPAYAPTMYLRRHLVVLNVRVELALVAGARKGPAGPGQSRDPAPTPAASAGEARASGP